MSARGFINLGLSLLFLAFCAPFIIGLLGAILGGIYG